MNDSRQLVIHIGNHKTGTTSIQRCLYDNRACLSDQGYSLFSHELDGTIRIKGNAHPWIKCTPGGGRISATLPEALAKLPGNVIISSESFSWLFDAQQIQQFQEGLKNLFGDIRIICYLRRQDLHAISHYQQGSKNIKFSAAKFYARGNRALPPYRPEYKNYLDYNQRIGLWADSFGDSSIQLRIFEKALLKNGDAVDDFFNAVALEYETKRDNKNVSLGFEATKINHLTNHKHVKQMVKKRILGKLDGGGKSLPGREDAEAFYSHFRESNAQLNQRFSLSEREFLFDDDFTMYPEKPADLWSEESANSAIGKLLAGIKSLPLAARKDVVLMRHCAELLSTKEPEQSAMLEALADRLEL